ncbi:MAG: NAD-dependent protein deacetylase [Myxococcota bacterium]
MGDSIETLLDFLRGRRVGVLTGAGLSTDSGIPDYRGPETKRRARNPIQYRQFMKDPASRQRYWARAAIGWERFSGAAPNGGHVALAELERAGAITGIVTQNVDRLHQRAGSERVVELHGALAEVVCLHCGDVSPRSALQARLQALNPGWTATAQHAENLPDGDADVERTRDFRIVSCDRCGGPLKPHVVFFGESVPKARVDAAWEIFDEADAILVVGSSLTVYSGYRFVRGAPARHKPVAILNLGETRGDTHAAVRLDAPATPALQAWARDALRPLVESSRR